AALEAHQRQGRATQQSSVGAAQRRKLLAHGRRFPGNGLARSVSNATAEAEEVFPSADQAAPSTAAARRDERRRAPTAGGATGNGTTTSALSKDRRCADAEQSAEPAERAAARGASTCERHPRAGE